jgi:hypothetical protein
MLAPTGAFAESTPTDGKVAFEFDTSDLRIVQPGTNSNLDSEVLESEGDYGWCQVNENTSSGFVKLLYAPNFDFGTVKVNYKEESAYSVRQVPALVDDKTTGWLNPFAQVVDYTDGTFNWDLKLQLANKFTTGSDTLETTKLKITTGNVLNDIAGITWDGTAYTNGGTDYFVPGAEAKTILSHAATSANMVNGAKWSYVFGPVSTNHDETFDGTITGVDGKIDSITNTRGKSDGVQLIVPAADRPKVGVTYHADLVWTLSSTPSNISEQYMTFSALGNNGGYYYLGLSPAQMATIGKDIFYAKIVNANEGIDTEAEATISGNQITLIPPYAVQDEGNGGLPFYYNVIFNSETTVRIRTEKGYFNLTMN